MRIGNNISNQASLHNQIKLLEPLFNKILLVNPIEKREILVHEFSFEDSHRSCIESCPLYNDACGCICKDTISTGEDRCRFTYTKTEAYLVISKFIKTKYRDYTLVMIMNLNPAFSFGAIPETDAIDNITKLSSNLVIDPLTHIFNRKYLIDNIEYMMKNASSQRLPLCLACIDIDNFKRFNDTYGHEFGDKVLIKVAELMSKSTEVIKEAYTIRIGGDEFVIIGIGIDKGRFKAIMNKLCLMVEDTKLLCNNEKVGIRISIGVSEMIADRIDTYKELYDKADSQLYTAKRDGKGCVR